MDASSSTSSALLAAIPASRGHVSHEPKLTPELHEELLKYIGVGISIQHSAYLAGVSPAAVFEWIRRGEGRETSGLINNVEPYVGFAKAVRKAQAVDFVRMHKTVHDAATGVEKHVEETEYNENTGVTKTRKKVVPHSETNINAAKWMLGRMFPEIYGAGREAITTGPASIVEDGENVRPVITILRPPDDE